MFDVAIIGAGPAGTAAAYDLLARGLRVLVLDKYEFPRKKACAGGITPRAYRLFRYDISSLVKRECSSVKITPSHDPSFFITAEKPLCYMTQREELDLFSLNKIMENGARFRVVKKIRSIKETPSSVEISLDSGCVRASYLIGADGANSIVRRFVSQARFCQKQFAIEADVKVDRPDRIAMEFDFSRAKNCYYWMFPRDDHVNIGIYSLDPAGRFRRQWLFDYAGEKLSSGRVASVHGYPICTGGFRYRPGPKRILLAGDAAGLAEPLLGEGIFFAVKSGQAAARAILASDPGAGDAGAIYLKHLRAIHADLRCYALSARWFYRFPRISLKTLSFKRLHNRFARGYADGKTLVQILLNRPVQDRIF